ncbi:hypothetical protein SAMN04488509_10850 [Aquimonas voraii]|uniref:Cytochrome C Planctomycete-type domain-containing protein n=2 Tax=Aquimonas voraii TaxID=265719 RepID=A0A1G6XZ39_9GAMM|nr:hypothetical protein SAMN04488509_10850 [Aquimonas voraii]
MPMNPNLQFARCAALAFGLSATLAAGAQTLPAGCDELPASTYPIRYDVSFEADIRPLLESEEQRCTVCHGSSGNLSLSFANARSNLLGAQERGVASAGDASANPILRVRPREPLASSLFLKLNCATPPFGGRMPLGLSPSPELQALVHDWIASGALMPDSPGGVRLFIGGFESIRRPSP